MTDEQSTGSKSRLASRVEGALNGHTPHSAHDYVWTNDIQEMLDSIRESYISNWLGGDLTEPRPYSLTRISQIGKPMLVQAARLPHIQAQLAAAGFPGFGPEGEDGAPLVKDAVTHRRFHYGNVLEAETLVLLRAHGITVTDTQTEVCLSEEHNVLGHSDGVIHFEGKRYVFDMKTMSDYSFRKYTAKQGPHDEGGYITQLACYHHLLGTDGAFILAFNKNSHQYRVLWLDQERMESRYARALKVVEVLAGCNDLDDLDDIPRPPSVEETYRRKPTGLWVPHPTIQWDNERTLCYALTTRTKYGKPKEYAEYDFDSIYDALIYYRSKNS
jgi:hypothetical protein